MAQSTRLFGTDGIRGFANKYPMTPENMLEVALSLATLSRQYHGDNYKKRVIIAKDTRLSGYMLEPALVSGFIAGGMDVLLLGPLPTPALSMLVQSMRADLGVMLSASHNPYYDNGIKIFGHDGHKISLEQENDIEHLLQSKQFFRAEQDGLGRAKRLDDVIGRYNEFAKKSIASSITLEGLKVVCDCANGAAYKIAPTILYELGADIIPIGINPNGVNVNQACGATHPNAVSQAVIEHKADIGIALDGDADRVILCNADGNIIDGDVILGILARHLHQKNLLKGAVIGTDMTNLGLEHYLRHHGIMMHRTRVGDKYISAKIRAGDGNLGGEQSGHIIFGDYCSTGDGIIAALQILAIMKEQHVSLQQLAKDITLMPQHTYNITVHDKLLLERDDAQNIIAKAHHDIGHDGHILVRMSGTEPLLRITVQAKDNRIVEKTLRKIQQEFEVLIA